MEVLRGDYLRTVRDHNYKDEDKLGVHNPYNAKGVNRTDAYTCNSHDK